MDPSQFQTALPPCSRDDQFTRYVQHGFHLTPLNGKKAYRANWTNEPYDPNLKPSHYPGNYGVVLQHDDIVVDYDPRNDTLPGGSLNKLEQDIGVQFLSTATFIVLTGNGGYHIYLKKPKDAKIRMTLMDYPGIEFKSRGHQVAGAGCTHPETQRIYTPVCGSQEYIAAAPESLLTLIRRQDADLGLSLETPLQTEGGQQRFVEYLRNAAGAVEGLMGDNQTYKVAATGKNMGLDEGTTLALMLEHWNHRCIPPWSPEELGAKVRNAYSYSQSALGSISPQALFKELVLPKAAEGFNPTELPWNYTGSLSPTGHPILKDNDVENLVNFFNCPTPDTHFADLYKLIQYNTFSQRLEFTRTPPWQNPEYPRDEWDDRDNALLRLYLWSNLNFKASEKNVEDAVIKLGEDNRYHPVKTYLESLVWDGNKRIDTFLINYAGAEDSSYTKAVTKNFFIAAVARIMRPGCQFDHVLILEGAQGIGKTSLLRILGGNFYGDVLIDPHNKDTFMSIQGKWLLELSEMEVMNRADMAALKAFITKLEDDFRPPFGKSNVKYPRQCVLAGTMNPDGSGYLKDVTGNRRFWPIHLRKVHLGAVKQLRDQLWAEAMHRFKQGENWYFTDEHLAMEAQRQQALRQIDDPWEDCIESWLLQQQALGALPAVLTRSRILEYALGIRRSQIDQRASNRLKTVMRKLGFSYGVYRCAEEGGRSVRGYRKLDIPDVVANL